MKYSAQFSGSNHLSVANYTGNPASFSVSCWVYLAVAQLSRIFFSNYGGQGWAPGISDGTNNKLKFFLGSNTLSGSGTLTTAAWTHAVFTYDGTTAKIYVGGNTTPDATLVSAVVYGAVPANNYIGTLNGASQRLNGNLAALGVWSKALSTTEVTSLYNSGNGLLFADLSGTLLTSLTAYYDFSDAASLGTDSSAGAHTMANTGTVLWTGNGPSGAAYEAAGPPRPPYAGVSPAWKMGLGSAVSLANENGSVVGVHDLLSGQPRVLAAGGTAPVWGRDQWGRCLSLSASTFAGILVGRPIPGGASEFTLAALCTYDPSATVVTNRNLWCEPSGGNQNVQLVLNGGLLQFQLNTGLYTNLTTPPPASNRPVLVTIRLTKAGVRSIWYGSYKQAERTDVGGVYGSGATSGLIMAGGLGSWGGNFSAGYAWSRALSDAEIVALAADPFAPVRPRRMSAPLLALGSGALGNRRRRVLLCAGGG